MRGSYTNISGRRCSRLCFGSSNDFIFCSTHSSTSLLRNKKRLPTKSWVSPFLHRYESFGKQQKSMRGCQTIWFRWQSKQRCFFVKSKVTLHFEKIQTQLRLHDFHASQASCYYKDTEFLWWSTPLLRTAEHISCCLPALLESRAEFSAKWLQKVPKPCDFWVGCLVLLNNEGACIVNDFSPFGCQSCPLLWKLKSKGIDHFGRCDVVKWSQLSKCVH